MKRKRDTFADQVEYRILVTVYARLNFDIKWLYAYRDNIIENFLC